MPNRTSLQAVLFDWDCTLLDSYHADSRAYAAMFDSLGVPWSASKLKKHYAPDWHRVYRAAALPKSRWAEADRLWRRFYQREEPRLQRGARRVLVNLAARYRLGLVTGGSTWRVRAQLRSLALTSLFETRVYGEDATRRKLILRRCFWPCSAWTARRKPASTWATRPTTCSWRDALVCR